MPLLEATELLTGIVGERSVSDGEPALTQLAQLCGGLPLALRIIGNRLVSRPGWSAAELAARLAAFMADAQVPWGMDALGGAVTEPAWRHKPSRYLVATEDRMIPPPAQRAMAERAGSSVVEAIGSHAVYVSQPPRSPTSSAKPPPEPGTLRPGRRTAIARTGPRVAPPCRLSCVDEALPRCNSPQRHPVALKRSSAVVTIGECTAHMPSG
ncbi:alpha/beta fold hydrolase [Nonomuraea sp. NPDC003709]|uniref:alpha/beta fold hydrolase n=1 Tax=Nonomuraea sp. NPDC003709 TaxID=3154450 RepID=UPI00339FA5FF